MNSFIVAIIMLMVGFALGLSLNINVVNEGYNEKLAICDTNNFTYQKCAELYGWDLE